MLKVEGEEETCAEGGVEPGSGQWIETVGEAGSGKPRRGNAWVALTCQEFHHNFPRLPLLRLYIQCEPSRCRKQQHSSVLGDIFKYWGLS